MAANGRGYMRPNSAGRTPPFLIIGLLVVIGILAFNYWNLSSKNSALTKDVDEVEMKYRSVQMRKLDVEKRNADLSVQLEEAKKYRLEAQEKDMRLREAEQKEKELNAKIDSLAGEIEVLKNDLNTCDDEVGFCHENITKMIISHKKALEEAHMKCNMKIDEAKSSAEQRAASVEKHDLQQSHLEPQPIQQQPLQGQQHPLQEEQPLQGQQHGQEQVQQGQQQPLQGQQQPLQEQVQPLQGQQQPIQGQQQPLQGQQQPLQQQQTPQGQQQLLQEHKVPAVQQQPQLQQSLQEQPQLQHPFQEQPPHDHLQPQQNQIGEPQQLQQQRQDVTDSKHDGHVEQNQEAKDSDDEAHQGKEPVVLEGLSQTNDLARAVQEGYNRAPAVEHVEVPQQEWQQEASVSGKQSAADQVVQGQKQESLGQGVQQASVVQQSVDQVAPTSSQHEHMMIGHDKLHDINGQQQANAPTGHAIVQENVAVPPDDKQVEVPADLNQRRDEETYVGNEAAPVGQAIPPKL